MEHHRTFIYRAGLRLSLRTRCYIFVTIVIMRGGRDVSAEHSLSEFDAEGGLVNAQASASCALSSPLPQELSDFLQQHGYDA